MRRRQQSRTALPIQPWRFVLVAVAVILAVPLGIAAAQPVNVGGIEMHVWNGADLGVMICLAIFASAFVIGSRSSDD